MSFYGGVISISRSDGAASKKSISNVYFGSSASHPRALSAHLRITFHCCRLMPLRKWSSPRWSLHHALKATIWLPGMSSDDVKWAPGASTRVRDGEASRGATMFITFLTWSWDWVHRKTENLARLLRQWNEEWNCFEHNMKELLNEEAWKLEVSFIDEVNRKTGRESS